MFVVCTSMPKPGTFSCLKVLKNRPTDPGLGWDAEMTSVAEDLRQMVKILYSRGPGAAKLTAQEVDAIYEGGLDPEQAASRVLPYLIEVSKMNRPYRSFVTSTTADILSVEPAGEGFVRAVTLSRPNRLALQQWVVDELKIDPATLDTMESRSRRDLAQLVAFSDTPVTTEGTARVILVPANVNAVVTRSGQGEFVREVPRVWV